MRPVSGVRVVRTSQLLLQNTGWTPPPAFICLCSGPNTMRVHVILLLFCLLASLGLFTVLVGQYKEMEMIEKKHRSLDVIALDYQKTLEYDSSFKHSLEALVTQGEKTAQNLEESLSEFNLEQKKAENDNCLEETRRKKEELGSMQRTHNQTLETLNAEANVWKEELISIKAHLTEYTPICNHLKNTTAPSFRQLCGNTSS